MLKIFIFYFPSLIKKSNNQEMLTFADSILDMYASKRLGCLVNIDLKLIV